MYCTGMHMQAPKHAHARTPPPMRAHRIVTHPCMRIRLPPPQASGLVCVFSMKNPSHPEYSLNTEAGVMCLHFHPEFPNLLAVGESFMRGQGAAQRSAAQREGRGGSDRDRVAGGGAGAEGRGRGAGRGRQGGMHQVSVTSLSAAVEWASDECGGLGWRTVTTPSHPTWGARGEVGGEGGSVRGTSRG